MDESKTNRRWCESLELKTSGTPFQRCLDAVLRYPSLFTRLCVGTAIINGKSTDHCWLQSEYGAIRDPYLKTLAGEYHATQTYTTVEVIDAIVKANRNPF